MICLIGADGSMGKRYQAILRYLKKPFICLDKEADNSRILSQSARGSHGFIVATPTDTHIDYVTFLAKYKKPILCEKPVTKNMRELATLRATLERYDTPFRMMYQYSELVDSIKPELSRYDYFRHGPDGLIWDCLQIIGLAQARVELKEESPFWECQINGQKLQLSDMDWAYIKYVRRWLRAPAQDLGRIQAIHDKVDHMEKRSHVPAAH